MNLNDMSGLFEIPETKPTKVVEVDHAPLLANRTPAKTCGTFIAKQESPRQRMVLDLASKGKNQKEIAEIVGYSPQHVGTILRQPMLQQTLVDEIRRTVDSIDEEVLEIIKIGCLDSANRLLNIIRDDKAKGSDHIAAANTFLERRYGKANQPINSRSMVDLNNLSDSELAKHLTSQTSGTTTSS